MDRNLKVNFFFLIHFKNEKIHQLEKQKKDLEDEKSKNSGHQKHDDNFDAFVQVSNTFIIMK